MDCKDEALESAQKRSAKLEAALYGINADSVAMNSRLASANWALGRRLHSKQARLQDLAGAIRDQELESEENRAAEDSRRSNGGGEVSADESRCSSPRWSW